MKLLLSILIPVAFSQTCVINIAQNALSSNGLATPYTVTGCDQADVAVTSFIQGAVFDPAKKKISIYNPLLINAGTKPTFPPTPVNLPAGAVVALWFGSNAGAIALTGPGKTQANCVDGLSMYAHSHSL